MTRGRGWSWLEKHRKAFNSLGRPGPHTSINNIHFSEQILAILAIPWMVDEYEDAVLNATCQDNHFTHDQVKNSIKGLLSYDGIVSEVEPYGVFAGK